MSATGLAFLLLLAPGVPLVLAILVMIPASRRWGLALAPVAAAPALLLTGLGGVEPPIAVPWLMIGALLGLGAVEQIFLFLTSLIWLLGGLYARSSVAGSAHESRFFACFLLAMAGNLGLVISQGMLLFYMFFALMSFATYGLVVHDGSPEARRAGRIYLVFVVIGEMALFAALLLGYQASISFEFEQVRAAMPLQPAEDLYLAMLFVGFGIKSGAILLHVWMPLAYRATPIAAAAVLSGAMFSAGLLGWLQLLPIREGVAPGWGAVLTYAGLAATFYGVLVGLTQRDPKALLAYSSMSQMGLMTAGLGAAFAVTEEWPAMIAAVILFTLHHALAKASLFLGIGVARLAHPKQAWLIGAGLLLPALALAGLPATSGALAKAMLKEGAIAAGPEGSLLYAVLPWSSLATTLLMGRFLWLGWPRPSGEAAGAPPDIWAPWAAMLLAVATAVWFVPWAEAEGIWTTESLLGGLWPIAIGAVLAALAAWSSSRGQLKLPFSIPPGDVLVPVGYLSRAVLAATQRLGDSRLPAWRRRALLSLESMRDALAGTSIADRIEARISRWRAGIAFFLLLAVVLAGLMVATG